MKKLMLLSLMLGALPLTMTAQDDDMYFVPTKKAVEKQKATYALPQNVYYAGSNRSIDEYNRRVPPMAMPTDTALCDTIDFDGQRGVYPDSLQEDFMLTQQMSRWDGYEPGQSYWDGYADGRRDGMWHSPWFYSSLYPWYDAYWYDPWYMDRYYLYHGMWGDPWFYSGWYNPWYYGYYGYGYYPGYYPYYYGYGWYPSYAAVSVGPTGTQNHGKINYGGPRGISNGRSTAYSAGTFGGSRIGTSNRNGNGLGTRNTGTASRNTTTAGRTTNAYGNFGGNRARTATTTTSSSTRNYTPTMTTSSSSSSGGGSFGGSSSVGGSRSSGGGGSFGGSRSGGGGSFGGRR